MKSWGIGAWAAEAEREEAEEKERAASAAAAAAAAPMEAFPTLGESLSVKPKKKKQQQTFSLAELTIGKSVTPGSRSRSMSDSYGLTTEEMMMLPTGPRDRSSEDEQRGGLGGAFRDYRDFNRTDREQSRGGFGGGYERDREGGGFLHDRERHRDEPSRADDSSNWSSSKKQDFPRGSDSERRMRGLDREPLPPSRADEVDNWGLVKKSIPDVRRRERFDDLKQHSRADEADNWATSKKPLPPQPPRATQGHDAVHAQSRADEANNWSLSKKFTSTETSASGRNSHVQAVGAADLDGRWGRRADICPPQSTEEPPRRRIVIAPRSRQSSPPAPVLEGDVDLIPGNVNFIPLSQANSNPFEVLADRGQDSHGSKNELGLREQDSRPSISHSSRPDTSEVSVEPTVRARPKINPFGNAKPREVLLQERGKDWRKMDFEYEHRGVDRLETQEEMLLKEEIKNLTELCNKVKETGSQKMNGVVADDGADSQESRVHTIMEELRSKEKQLEILVRDLDDRVRYSQKVGDRPGSRSGRSDGGRSYDMPDRPGSWQGSRPSSRSGRSDAGRNYDLLERPGSQSGRRNFDSSESPRSHSGYGGRVIESGERWSHGGHVEGNRNPEPLEKIGSWAGFSESGRSFDSLQRQRRRPAVVPSEVGGAKDYSREIGGPDIWTNELGHDRQGGWNQRESVRDRAGMRRF